MNKNIEHYIYHKENFLDEKYCENCVNELNDLVWKKHEWYNSKTGTTDEKQGDNEPEVMMGVPDLTEEQYEATLRALKYQKASADWLSDPDLNHFSKINDFIMQELYVIIAEYISIIDIDWFTGWSGYSDIKFLRYHSNQRMENHCDHIHDMFDGERKGIPTLSIIGILNDDYEGGELIMFQDKKIDTKKGDLLIFPSNFLYPHEIMPVTKGARYSYVSWAW